ncbi:thioredoxin domain-containing protein [Flavobacterium litorale]|uniref:Thioredoxin domain-containing protein n=1 Tax=Flavobacterium litorale TaxID=2856519 RepID=A0ABX8VEZ1_9FLAO|nr:thioredoxin domain-containing protein [Flavobacterium litorale]QYJ69400.1 thioredoxin domain-containing protein [Flavobacterium litorale]
MNELHKETSPYLLQHANNPIYWKAWNQEALKKAKEENKLIVVSVGYSACHWCHVMEHESFEDEEVATVMNKHYISIKVDREERPDVDAVYMKAVQLMTRQGGWPMNVVLLPDGKPVWGGTYFKKENWISALKQLQDMYTNEPEKMIDYAEKLYNGVAGMNLAGGATNEALPPPENIKPIVDKWTDSFDNEYGGYARAPKFMMPNNYLFLQRYGHQTNNTELLHFVDLTLTRMAWGGLFDTVGGGFSRYSVDMKWHVPHFEKMLYDNGQLMSLYAEAYKRTKNKLYKEVLEKTHRFIKEVLTAENGAFYSALDADSLDEKGRLEEGAFYVWTKNELQDILGNDFDLFATVFNSNDFGYWEEDNYVLIQNQPIDALAEAAGIAPETLHQKKKHWEGLLYAAREKRAKPRLDDKILTSWNALMLKGYIDCYQALGDEHYLDIALKNAEFIANTMWHENGYLWRTYKNGTAKIQGFLEDYAHTSNAFIALHQATMDEKWLLYAKQLADYCLDNFYNEKQQFFSFNAANSEQLIAPHFETEDNVIPASNSVMGNVLYTLSLFFHNNYYEKVALQMLYNIIPSLDYPSAFSNWLNLWLTLGHENKELAICGKNANEAAKAIHSEYLPHIITVGCTSKSQVPILANRFVKDSVMFYVCKNNTCNLPTNSIIEVTKQLKI